MARLDSNIVSLVAAQLYNAEDKKTLESLRLVSRESSFAAKPWLYRSLELNFSSMDSVNALVDFHTTPQNSLASYVHEIVINNGGHPCSQSSFDELESILPKFPAVRRVVCAAGVMISHKLTRLLCDDPRIHELSLQYSMGNEDIELGDDGEPFPLELIGSTKLTCISINYDQSRDMSSSLKRLMLEASALKSVEINFEYSFLTDMDGDFAEGGFIKFSENEVLPPLESLVLQFYDLQPCSPSGLGSRLQWPFLRDLTMEMVDSQYLASILDHISTMSLSLRSLCLGEILEKISSQDWRPSLIAFLHCFKGLWTLEIARTSIELGAPGMIDAIVNHGSTLRVLKIHKIEMEPQKFPITLEGISNLCNGCPHIQELKIHLPCDEIFRENGAPSPYEQVFQNFRNLQTLRVFVPLGADAPEVLTRLRETQLINRIACKLRAPVLRILFLMASEVNPDIYKNDSLPKIIRWENAHRGLWEVRYFDSDRGGVVIKQTASENCYKAILASA